MGNFKRSQSESSEITSSSRITTFTAPMPAIPARYVLKPGEYLHDSDESKTLINFTRHVCSMTVYGLFFDYATVISKDSKDSSVICEQHGTLNRYKDIRCLDQTRVKVPNLFGCIIIRSFRHPSDNHDYINANYVDGFRENKKFILTQSPMENTVESFWAMIYQENLTFGNNIFVYSNQTVSYRYIRTLFRQILRITLIRDAYEASVLKLRKGDGQERKILHICFYAWHNKGTPERPTEMLYLVSDINYNRKLFVKEAEKSGWLTDGCSPIVVHCLTGSGRSGTLAVLDICCRKMDYTEKLPNGNVLVDVRDTVLRVRTQRDKAVMKPEQYLLLHLLVIEYALRQKYYDDIDFIDLSNYTGAA
ncbi:Tyrosine-protein phosphatase non-receptor type 9 [Dirofilaria immitis]|nr:Tyrosine-protein phosphatase non-receptor type 9 [Dirofilaria immitis]